MNRIVIVLFFAPFLAASAPATRPGQSIDDALKRARAEQAAADVETDRLQNVAAQARDEAQKLQAEQAAAAQGIEAAEARITAADTQFRLASAYVAAHQQQLAQERQPVSSLLTGLAVMAQRPPLLSLADRGGTDEFVRIGILLDATLPVIRSRTQRLSAQLNQEQRLEEAAHTARQEQLQSQRELAARRQQFAEFERRAAEQSLTAGGAALRTGDVAIAAGEQIERLKSEQSSSRAARQNADLLAVEAPAPGRPFIPSGPQLRPPFAYALPVDAPVVEGLGAVNDSGVRSRGIRFATLRGTAVVAPGNGTVRFSGPFRDYDGVLILDHGAGWMTLLVNVSSPLKKGDKVRIGDSLGRALGPVLVELSHNGQQFSPALIAGSSGSLSKGMKGG